MIEIGAGLVYGAVKDAILLVRRGRRRLTQADRVDLRAKWKKEIEDELDRRRREGLRQDVYIRDVRRIDEYPEIKSKRKGISPWFKAGLMGTYHRGIRAGLDWVALIVDGEGRWSLVDYAAQEKPTLTAALTGLIRYENIQHIDWDGDEFGGHPHVYCHFDEKGGVPYESVQFAERRELDGFPYYVDLDTFDSVVKNTKRRGVSSRYT